MGWDGVKLDRGQTREDYVRKMMGGAKNVVAMATVNGTIYAAVRCDIDSEVGLFKAGDILGMAVLTDYRDGYTMFKFLDEFMGPAADEAPAALIQKLSPLREVGEKFTMMREWARSWRQRCLDNNLVLH